MHDEREELRRVVRDFLDQHSPEAAVRELMETGSGLDRRVWSRAAAELGVAGLLVPEQFGGAGAGMAELGVVFEEAGRALWCSPLLSTCGLASCVLLHASGAGVHRELLPGIADGSTVAALAWNGVRPEPGSLRARRPGGRWVIDGSSGYVVDGATADLLLVCAAIEDGVGLFRVDPADAMVRPRTTLDSTRRLAEVTFAAAPAEPISADAGDGLDRALACAFDCAELLLAAEQLGGATRALEMAVEYAKARIQFGRPIGSFQAVKHKLAEMLMAVELAKACVRHAFDTADHAPERLPLAVSQARAVVGDGYPRVAADSIQVHGGLGFTWEHPAHLYLKRAKSSQLLFGSPKWHRARIGDLLGIPVPALVAAR
ncbi:MAG TPA: acyl-CoA dehydrogenase family protein [Pseudonocardia sp.]|jgi:alkylation response protein AidB-like acyl-CoA dehydrogenase